MSEVYESYLHEDSCEEERDTEINKELAEYVLNNIERDSSGRLIVPCLWNSNVEHLLPKNYYLAKNILDSTKSKLIDNKAKFIQYDEVINKQISNNILVKSSDIEELKRNRNVSFIPHTAVFRPEAESTKCRLVLMSNLCERRDGSSLSHNQISMPGPQLNNKLVITCMLYRFNKYLLISDIVQAFFQLAICSKDAEKLHILWFKDVANDNYELVAYKYNRVPMGLRFSPCLLMLSLFYILIENTDKSDIFNMTYNLAYMDNLGYSSSNINKMYEAYECIKNLFAQYQISLQKFHTNVPELQMKLSDDCSKLDNETSLFGIIWNKSEDIFKPCIGHLNIDAKTRRQILSSLNSNYDPLGIYLPTLNRCKMFLHKIINDGHSEWDKPLDSNLLREWRNICIQFNSNVNLTKGINRYVGDYEQLYNLVCFVDASKDMYGAVLYLQNTDTHELHFLLAKNKIANKNLACKSIPILELISMQYGVQVMKEIFSELSNCYCPINIVELHLHTDSMISLNWLHSKVVRFDKIERKPTIVNNKLNYIVKECEKFPIVFHHIDGSSNPSDFVTRPISGKLLEKSNYIQGPDLQIESIFSFAVPHSDSDIGLECMHIVSDVNQPCESIIDLKSYSSFRKLCRVFHCVRRYIFNLKCKVNESRPDLFKDISMRPVQYSQTVDYLLRQSQREDFSEVFNYFENPVGKCPPIINQLNLFLDNNCIIRVKGKMERMDAPYGEKYPVLLHKKSKIIDCIVLDFHYRMMHAGLYRLLTQLRREFYVPSIFSVVKRILGSCIVCKRINGRKVRLNANSYQSYRINPAKVPFRDIALDHIGPFIIKDSSDCRLKIYILIITCLYTRAINLRVCHSINNKSFLQALQTHIFEYGICQRIISDNGSPIVSSISSIKSYLSDTDVKLFLQERNIRTLDFMPYPAGASFLGGTVESLVKQVKNLFYSSVSRKILIYEEFEFIVNEIKMLINKRPLGFKQPSYQPPDDNIGVLTPELLLKGYDVPSLSIIPQLDDCDDFFTNQPSVSELYRDFKDLRSCRQKLYDIYDSEFVNTLRNLSLNSPGKYSPRDHVSLNVGDLVLIRSKFLKPYHCPMGIVVDTELNNINETVAVTVRKSNGERIRRHVSDIVLLENAVSTDIISDTNEVPSVRPKRAAANASRIKTNNLYEAGEV